MMKKKIVSMVVLIVLMTGVANALVATYELGEMDGAGAVPGALGLDPTVDSIGGINLSPLGDPTYSDNAAPTGSVLSMSFDGDDVYHGVLPAPGPTDNLSLSAWVYATEIGGFNFVAALGDPGNMGLGLLQVGGNWGIIHMGVEGNFNGPAVELNTWTKLELRRSAGISELYVNDAATGVTIAVDPFAPTTMSIGANPHPTAGFEGYFVGQIDDVMVIPEPATMGLLGLGGLLALRRRKRA